MHILLHVFNHWAQHGADWAVECLVGEVNYMLWDPTAKQELREFVAEVVAIVCEQVVRRLGETWAHFLHPLLQHLEADRGSAHRQHLHGLHTKIRDDLLRWHRLDPATEEILVAMHYHAGVPDAVDLLAEHCHRELPRHGRRIVGRRL